MKRLPQGALFNAICETHACLPDAIQLLTPCTMGNSQLKIINLGRFALSFYEKDSGRGVRIFLHAGQLESWPEITAWLFKLKPKAEQNQERLLGVPWFRVGPNVANLRETPILSDPYTLRV